MDFLNESITDSNLKRPRNPKENSTFNTRPGRKTMKYYRHRVINSIKSISCDDDHESTSHKWLEMKKAEKGALSSKADS